MVMGRVMLGDCLVRLKELEDNSVDSIVTDPPYELGFMGKKWDKSGIAYNKEMWVECLRVLKPGGYLLAFGGTRTYHRMVVAIEDAGFEVRDMIEWCYGSGFPKSLNIGKAVDKYEGWGTALKPAHEPICMARKPLSEKTVAENCLKWGTGGINIDESRVDFVSEEDRKESTTKNQHADFGTKPMTNNNVYGDYSMIEPKNFNPTGRFPANLIHDNSEEVRECFPETKSQQRVGKRSGKETGIMGAFTGQDEVTMGHNDSGNASRFFKSIIYQAKASKSERNKGCEELEEKPKVFNGQSDKPSEDMKDVEKRFTTLPKANNHPTVKPVALIPFLSHESKLIRRVSHNRIN